MAKLQLNAPSGGDYYAVIRGEVGAWWNDASSELGVYASLDWEDYALALIEEGSSGVYQVDVPLALPAGNYTATFFRQAGAAPAEGDSPVAGEGFAWDGGAFHFGGHTIALEKYAGRLWIQGAGGYGSQPVPYVHGTRDNPVVNLISAFYFLAIPLGIYDFEFFAGLHRGPAAELEGGASLLRLFGSGPECVLDVSSTNLTGIEVNRMAIVLIQTQFGPTADVFNLRECLIGADVEWDAPIFRATDCVFESGLECAQFEIVRGRYIASTSSETFCEFRGPGASSMNYWSEWSGNLALADFAGKARINLRGGKLKLTGTVASSAVIYLEGFGELIDQSDGATIVKSGFVETTHVDAAVSSRLAEASYTAPANSTISSINSNVLSNKTKIDSYLDATVSSRLSSTTFNAEAADAEAQRDLIQAQTDKLRFTAEGYVRSSAQNMRGTDGALLAANYTAPANGTISTIASNVASVKSAVDANLDAAVSTRLAASSYSDPTSALAGLDSDLGDLADLVGTRLDVAVSSRLASSSYTAPDNSTIGTIASNVASVKTTVDANLDAAVSSRLAASSYADPTSALAGLDSDLGDLADLVATRLDVAVSSRLASSSYVAPENAAILAASLATGEVLALLAELTEEDGEGESRFTAKALEEVSVTADLASVAGDVTAIWGVVDSRLDVAVSSRLASSNYTAPDNSTIGTIATDVAIVKSTVDANLDAAVSSRLAASSYVDPTSELDALDSHLGDLADLVATRLDVAVSTRLASSGYTAPDNSTIGTISSNVADVKTTVDANLDAAVSSRLASTSYVAPDNASIEAAALSAGAVEAILAELTEEDGGGASRFTAKALEAVSVAAIASAVASQFKFTEAGAVEAHATNMRGTDDALLAAHYVAPDNEGIGLTASVVGDLYQLADSRLDVAVSSRLASSSYTAPANAAISAMASDVAIVKGTVDSRLDVAVSSRSSHGPADVLRASVASGLASADRLSLAALVLAALNSYATDQELVLRDGTGADWQAYALSTSPPGKIVTGVSESG